SSSIAAHQGRRGALVARGWTEAMVVVLVDYPSERFPVEVADHVLEGVLPPQLRRLRHGVCVVWRGEEVRQVEEWEVEGEPLALLWVPPPHVDAGPEPRVRLQVGVEGILRDDA